MNFTIDSPRYGTSAACEPILRSLPDWFGIEDAIVNYAREIDNLPTLLAQNGEQVLGFLTFKKHNPYSAEVYVMGIRPEFHHLGIGKALLLAAEVLLRDQDVEYLHVKTLGPSHPDEGYARTRLFYSAMNFRPLEEFTHFWDDQNPCLVMIKRL